MPQNTYVAPVVTASSTTWSQLKTGGLAVVLANLATANPAKADPTTTATVSVSGSAGLLPVGVYRVMYSFVDAFGETLAGGESATFTQTSGAKPAVTLPALPTGVQSINVYLTPPGGASGSETLYATGVTATSFTLDYAAPADNGAGLPVVNTTGWPTKANLLLVAGGTDPFLQGFNELLSQYLGGGSPNPPSRRQSLVRFRQYNGVLAAWSKVAAEVETLVAANPPTGVTVGAGVGSPNYKWTLP